MKCIAGLPMEEFDRKISFTITTTQTNEDKKNGFVFIQTQAVWRTRMLNECSCERVPWNIYAGAVNCTNSIPLKSFIFIILYDLS